MGTKTLNFSLAQIIEQRKELNTLAGNLLWKKEYDLRIKPETLSDEFFNIAKRKAIKLGAPSPEVLNLADERASLATARARIATLEDTIRTRDASIESLRSPTEVNACF